MSGGAAYQAAQAYVRAGISVIPVPSGKKIPVLKGWPKLRLKEADLPEHFNGKPVNMGALLGIGGLADLDLDSAEAVTVAASFAPETGFFFGRSSSPYSHYFYRSDPVMKSQKFVDPLDKTGEGGDERAVLLEIRSLTLEGEVGNQTVLPPSVHPSGERYEFSPGSTKIIGNVDSSQLEDAARKIAAASLFARYFAREGCRHVAFLALGGIFARAGWTEEEAFTFLFAIYRVLWRDAADRAACKSEVKSSFEKHKADAPISGIPRLKELINPTVVNQSLEWLGISGIQTSAVLKQKEVPSPSTDAPVNLLQFQFNDLGNAERIRALHGENMRYCVAEGSWYLFDGKRFRADALLATQKLAKLTMLEFQRQAIQANNEDALKFSRQCMENKRIVSALESLKCELSVEVSIFDQQPHLLNFLNCTVDLKTGAAHPHRREDFLSKIVHHNYEPVARCATFLRFVRQCMGAPLDASEDALLPADEKVLYLQRVFGYCLTAETREKAILVAWGELGDNGKTTLLSLMRDLCREYSCTVSLDLLTSREENTNTLAARADLMGKRFAVTSETEEGQRLTAAKLKRICQGSGGQIEACRKYANRIVFSETHKLLLDANFKPEVSANDHAIWNRLHLVEFPLSIPKEKQDRDLRNKLLENEAEGILAWAVAGAQQYYTSGLQKPACVTEATEKWREEMDRLREFLDENVQRLSPPNFEQYIRNKILFARYREWCGERHCRPLNQTAFSAQMIKLNYEKKEANEGWRWLSLKFL